MRPVITDADTGRELWRGTDCAQHCHVSDATWRSYVRRGMPPDAVTDFGPKVPLWDADEVRTWHANRPGSPGRPRT